MKENNKRRGFMVSNIKNAVKLSDRVSFRQGVTNISVIINLFTGGRYCENNSKSSKR